jgi:pimeloyl-ACP methyl ester carboxylesterase
MLALVYVGLSGYMALKLTQTIRRPFTQAPEQYGLAYEGVTFPSRVDALRLQGWLLAVAPGVAARRPIVVVHGRNSDRQGEVQGHILGIAAALVGRGHPVLLFDLRSHGRSPGARYTLGAHEVRDVGGAIDLLDRRGMVRDGVNLLGFSMGAAAAMLAAPGDPRVRAIAEDSGYADLHGLLEEQVPKASGLPPFFTPGVVLMARPLLGVDARKIRPMDGLPQLAARGTALLVIHAEADPLVPASHGRRLAAAYGPRAETLFVQSTTHVGSHAADPTTYLSRLTAFFERTG